MVLKKLARPSYRAMNALDAAVADSGLERPLAELVRIRASQLNGCVYCLDAHTTDARALGETEQRIYGLSAWREAPYYTDRERAALTLTEAVTLIHEGHVPDQAYDVAAAEFDQEELASLIWTITVINAWNRVAISTRMEPGT
ncbi:MAG: carboxymuconolactone decarboxylase family protein [Propionibacteriales bacterium]|nr:carboxymuconolactone decarboxylase family protein [Propionibacteriales bacterium]